ncbi:MAG: hypothetical protein OES70_08970, partial [Desulfobacterales bacterium]|nr:hypothetical protein [Desulfobacterales bacterium]
DCGGTELFQDNWIPHRFYYIKGRRLRCWIPHRFYYILVGRPALRDFPSDLILLVGHKPEVRLRRIEGF